MLSIKEAKKKAEAVIGSVRYTGKDEDCYMFAMNGIDEESDIGGAVWVLNHTGKVAKNPFEYLKYLREQHEILGISEEDE